MSLPDGKIATTTSTPLHTKDWYVKWVASVIILIGMVFTAQNIYPLNLFIEALGILGWLIVSIMWNDRALICVNVAGLTIMVMGIIEVIMEWVPYEPF